MGNGFKEKASRNIDPKKFKENHSKIFGERVKVECRSCKLSSRHKIGSDFKCPHCEAHNLWDCFLKTWLIGGRREAK